MKKLEHIIISLLMFIISNGWAQKTNPVLKISENIDGEIKAVEPNSSQIVDINGYLEIEISKPNLLKRIHDNYPLFGTQIDLQNKINQLTVALEKKEELYAKLNQSIRSADDDKSLNIAIINFMNAIEDYPDLEAQYNALYYEWDNQYGNDENPSIVQEFYILREFNSSLSELIETFRNYKGPKFCISLLAYLKNDQGGDRVHIANFDTYSEREFYKVERWVTNISENQRNQLKALEEKTKTLNEKATSFFENLKVELTKYIPDLTCVSALKADLIAFLDDPSVKNNISEALSDDAKILFSEYEKFLTLISFTKSEISNWSISEPFEVIEQVKALVALKNNLNELKLKFENTAIAVASLGASVSTLISNADTCYAQLKLDIETLSNLMAMMKNQQNRFVANREIGAEVIRFSFDNLPDKGYIDLKGSGKRENGDSIDIELAILTPESDNNDDQPKKHLVEKRILTMQLIGLRSETVVGIIMADSFNENGFTPLENKRFLYAPTAALLLKVGSRNSKLYNDFVDLGFGLAISTPDFNTDGTPEFGAGLMLTAFKDILSIGINYNVTLDTPYWSFGINLPFNLPGIPINNPN